MTEKPGPTGEYPLGRMSDDDEGELCVLISNETAPDGSPRLLLSFGKAVRWLGLTPEGARELGQLLIDRANDFQGDRDGI